MSPNTCVSLLAGHPVVCANNTMVWLMPADPVQEDAEYVVLNEPAHSRAGSIYFQRHNMPTAYGVVPDQRLKIQPGVTLAGDEKGNIVLASKQRLFVTANKSQLRKSVLTIYIHVKTKTLHIVEGDNPAAIYPIADIKVELAKNMALAGTEQDQMLLQQTADRLEQLVHLSSGSLRNQDLATFLPHAKKLFSFFFVAKNH